MKRTLLLFFVVFGFLFNTQAQTIDSLYACARNDNKVNYEEANKLIVALDALGCVDSLYVFTAKSSQIEMLGAITLYMSYYYYDNGLAIPALKMCLEAAKYAEMSGNLDTQSSVYSTMASVLHRIGDNERALEITRKGLHVDSLINDPYALSTSFNNMAAIVLAMGKPKDAIQYELKAIEYEKPLHEDARLAIRYGILSEAYLNNKQGKEAMQYAQMAYDLDRKIGNELGIARRLSQMGDAYFFQKDFKQAEKLYLRANEMLTQIGELNSLSINCKQLGELYFELNKNDQAVEWFLRADKLCAETGNRTIRVTVNEQISWVLKDSDPERSRKFLLYAKNLKDSIQTDKSLIYSSEYKAIFDAQEKEEQLLQQHQQRIVTICIVLAVVLLLIFAIILARRQQKKEKSNNAKNSHETTSGENDSEGNETEATETLDNVLEPSALTLKEYDEEQKKFLLAIMDFVNKNISNNMLSVEDVASHMCMSRSQLNRRVNNLLGGKSIVALINATRMEKACRLLKSTNKPINEICMECGYNDHSYFNRVFRATFDMTPKQYRNMPEL